MGRRIARRRPETGRKYSELFFARRLEGEGLRSRSL